MRDLLLLRYGELGLKGGNRKFFIKKLKRNIRKKLAKMGELTSTHGRLYFFPEDNAGEEAIKILEKTFGLAGIAPAKETELQWDQITLAAEKLIGQTLKGPATFKVETKRANKSFPRNSPEISRDLGAHLLSKFPDLTVDVHNPDILLKVEIRGKAFVYLTDYQGPGGLPVGTGGRGILMLSGGIDSPVAGWMMLKRGLDVFPVHFSSPPYTNERSLEKVKDLCRVLKTWGMERPLYNVYFTPVQEQLLQNTPSEYLTLLMRRMMVRLANTLGEKENCGSLITGESLGQVASQTIESLHSSGILSKYPVFRPLIGLDKQEIIGLAKRIGTYDISIQPHEDCCQVFVPQHPVTRPDLLRIEEIEEDLSISSQLNEALEKMEKVDVE